MRYNEIIYKSTHNSFTSNDKGSLKNQLDKGIRGIELDIHLYRKFIRKVFGLGHIYPGHEVSKGNNNPNSIYLRKWLEIINDWMNSNRDKGPITLWIDIKDDITKQIPNYKDLNKLIGNIFKDKLFRPHSLIIYRKTNENWDIWLSINELKNNIIIVLTGNDQTIQAYFDFYQKNLKYQKNKKNVKNCFVSKTRGFNKNLKSNQIELLDMR